MTERQRADRLIAIEVERADRITKMMLAEIDRVALWYRAPAFVAPVVATVVLVVVVVVGYAMREISIVYTPTGATP